MNQEEKEEIVDSALKRLGKFDRPLRELEHINYTFDILIDYGAFRDIQRHRMCTQTNQLVTTKHGYEIPDEIEEAGLKDYYVECMQKSQEAFEKIYNDYPNEAQYVVSMAFRKKVLFTWNLRELHHFIKLRTGPTGHISYRRMAYLVWEEIEKVHPFLAKYIDVTKP